MTRLPSIATSQRGGSTFMGLVAGTLLGMLMIIKWPGLAFYLTPYLERVQIDGASLLEGVHASQALTEDKGTQPQVQKAPSTSFLSAAPVTERSVHAASRETEVVANPPIESLNSLTPSRGTGAQKAAVWSAFSSEAAAQHFAEVVKRAIDADVLVYEAGPAKYVPEVACIDERECQSIKVAVHDFFNTPATGSAHE
jgi:hypothetical protein